MIGVMVPYRPAGAAVILPYGAESRAVSETDTHSPAAPGEQTCLVQPLPSGVCVTNERVDSDRGAVFDATTVRTTCLRQGLVPWFS